jgi:hypothetical protein
VEGKEGGKGREKEEGGGRREEEGGGRREEGRREEEGKGTGGRRREEEGGGTDLIILHLSSCLAAAEINSVLFLYSNGSNSLSWIVHP